MRLIKRKKKEKLQEEGIEETKKMNAQTQETPSLTEKQIQVLIQQNKMLEERTKTFQELNDLKIDENFRYYLLNNLANINNSLKGIGQALVELGKVLEETEEFEDEEFENKE